MDTRQNVESLDTASFRARLAALAGGGVVDDTAFAGAVGTALSACGITEERFRDAFGLGAGTVLRWARGENLPQPPARPPILGWIREQI